MASKKKEVQLRSIVHMCFSVVDVYQAWCGPCKAVVNLFRKLKNEYGEDDLLHFAVAEVNNIVSLLPFKDKCEPAFIFCVDGKMTDIVRGANGPLLTKKVIQMVEQERKIVAGEIPRPEVPLPCFSIDMSIKIYGGLFFLTYLLNSSYEGFLWEGPCHIHSYFHWFEINIISLFISLKGTLENQEMLNLCEVHDSIEETSRQLAYFFPALSKAKKGPTVERTLALIRPSLLRERRDSILKRIEEDGFEIAMQREIILTDAQAREFYKEHENQDYFPVLLEQMTSGPTLALALVKENAIKEWRGLLGPKVVQEAIEQCPSSLRAQFAIDGAPINQLHGSSTSEQAAKELEFFFPVENTLAVIKPTAFEEHKDAIMQEVKDAGFIISEMAEKQITPDIAAQFYKSIEGKPYFDQLCLFLIPSGPSMVMILTKENAVEEWRKLMGPTDPEKAKETHPKSLRAKFAENILHNAVHGASTLEQATENIKFPEERLIICND
uniref:Nucleoside diphosphate kinase-like domain-containing protein n=1 Tax=Salvator merianae TaxID=96440 RepID=A0A8D0E0W9_SALMN